MNPPTTIPVLQGLAERLGLNVVEQPKPAPDENVLVVPEPRPTQQRTVSKPMRAAVVPTEQKLAYTFAECAGVLSISYSSLIRLIRRGKIRVCGELERKRISRSECERYLADSTAPLQ